MCVCMCGDAGMSVCVVVCVLNVNASIIDYA